MNNRYKHQGSGMGSLLIYPDHFEKIEGAGDVKAIFPYGFEYADLCVSKDGVTLGAYHSELIEGDVNHLFIRLIAKVWPDIIVPGIRSRVLINAANEEGDDLPLDEKTLISMIKVLESILKK